MPRAAELKNKSALFDVQVAGAPLPRHGAILQPAIANSAMYAPCTQIADPRLALRMTSSERFQQTVRLASNPSGTRLAAQDGGLWL